MLVFNGTVIQGYDSARALQLKWWNQGTSDVVYHRGRSISTVLSPDAVVLTSQMSATRIGPDGKIVTGTFAAMSVWQKLAHGWRVVAAHESTLR